MNIFSDTWKRFLCLAAALLLVVQSLFAIGHPSLYHAADEDLHKQTELKQSDFSLISGVEASSRVMLSSLLFCYISHTFLLLDTPAIRCHNCKSFLTNAYTYNIYYTYTTALAP